MASYFRFNLPGNKKFLLKFTKDDDRAELLNRFILSFWEDFFSGNWLNNSYFEELTKNILDDCAYFLLFSMLKKYNILSKDKINKIRNTELPQSSLSYNPTFYYECAYDYRRPSILFKLQQLKNTISDFVDCGYSFTWRNVDAELNFRHNNCNFTVNSSYFREPFNDRILVLDFYITAFKIIEVGEFYIRKPVRYFIYSLFFDNMINIIDRNLVVS